MGVENSIQSCYFFVYKWVECWHPWTPPSFFSFYVGREREKKAENFLPGSSPAFRYAFRFTPVGRSVMRQRRVLIPRRLVGLHFH